MDETDIKTLASARRTPTLDVKRSQCGTCERPIYREPPFPGAIMEWRHASTGQPLSWQPERHLASETSVKPHQHKMVRDRHSARCSVAGCGAEMVHRQSADAPDPTPLNERDAKALESRKRGQFNSRASHQKRQPLA